MTGEGGVEQWQRADALRRRRRRDRLQEAEITHLRDAIEKSIPMIDQDGKACRLLRAALEWEPKP